MTTESDSYEVVLYETKDKTKRFIQVWHKGYDKPTYRRYTTKPNKFLWFGWTDISCTNYSSFDGGMFKQEMDIAIRKDTEKFPDLDKIAAYNKENGRTPYNDSN